MIDSFQSPTSTVGHALHLYKSVSPKDVQTLHSIFKRLFPELEWQELVQHLNEWPLSELKKYLEPNGSRWAPAIADALACQGLVGQSFFNSYPRFVKRMLDFAERAGLASTSSEPMLKEWETVLHLAALHVPQNKTQVEALIESGASFVIGRYPLDTVESSDKRCQNIRSALRALARAASKVNLTPRQFAEEVLSGAREAELGDLAGRSIYGSYCRHLWNATVQEHPELDLPYWGDRRRQVGIKMEEWPDSLQTGIRAAVFERPNMTPLKPSTVKSYRDKVSGLLGILEKAGLALAPLVGDLKPQEAVRLIFQGWPRVLLTGDPNDDSALSIYRRLTLDGDYRREVLGHMKAADGLSEYCSLAENPFITVVLDERFREKKFSSAEQMLDRVFTINHEYLTQRGNNLGWLKSRMVQVKAYMSEHETAYDEKKRVVFKNPMLQMRLIAKAHELFQSLPTVYKSKGSQWATFVRDLTYFSLATLYPLRIENYQLMQLDQNYDTNAHMIRFDGKAVKNGKPIDFELPDRGSFAWVRELVELYLHEARPTLLAGNHSNYFFVGNHRAPNANGYLKRQAYNEILIDFTAKYLRTVVPAELGNLNPHLFRHIAATYQIVICRDKELAAQLLNDDVRTVESHYSDLLQYARENTRDFYNDHE